MAETVATKKLTVQIPEDLHGRVHAVRTKLNLNLSAIIAEKLEEIVGDAFEALEQVKMKFHNEPLPMEVVFSEECEEHTKGYEAGWNTAARLPYFVLKKIEVPLRSVKEGGEPQEIAAAVDKIVDALDLQVVLKDFEVHDFLPVVKGIKDFMNHEYHGALEHYGFDLS